MIDLSSEICKPVLKLDLTAHDLMESLSELQLRRQAVPATHRKTEKERQFAEGRGGGRTAESYDRKEGWSSINHSIFSGVNNEYVYGS
jgi:hypothetical protein